MTTNVWLIEDGKTNENVRYRAWKDELPCWVDDPYEALWLVRRKDAEAISAGDEDAWIVEHKFEGRQPQQASEQDVPNLCLCPKHFGDCDLCEDGKCLSDEI